MLRTTSDHPETVAPEAGGTTLVRLAEAGDLESIRAIADLAHWVNWIPSGSEAGSALTCAVRAGHADVVDYLLDHGADIETRSPGVGNSVLMVACYNGHVRIAERLLDRGASWDYLSEEHAHALSHGARFSAVTELLLDRGVGAMLTREDAYSPLHQALNLRVAGMFSEHMDYRLLPDRQRVVQLLLAAGADPNAVSLHTPGMTVLMSAAYLGCGVISSQLLNAGANRDARDSRGHTVDDYYRRHLAEVRPRRNEGEPPALWEGVTIRRQASH